MWAGASLAFALGGVLVILGMRRGGRCLSLEWEIVAVGLVPLGLPILVDS